jgi:hypothetical protein
MKVRIDTRWRGYDRGEIINVTEAVGKELVRTMIATEVFDQPRPAPKPKPTDEKEVIPDAKLDDIFDKESKLGDRKKK